MFFKVLTWYIFSLYCCRILMFESFAKPPEKPTGIPPKRDLSSLPWPPTRKSDQRHLPAVIIAIFKSSNLSVMNFWSHHCHWAFFSLSLGGCGGGERKGWFSPSRVHMCVIWIAREYQSWKCSNWCCQCSSHSSVDRSGSTRHNNWSLLIHPSGEIRWTVVVEARILPRWGWQWRDFVSFSRRCCDWTLTLLEFTTTSFFC